MLFMFIGWVHVYVNSIDYDSDVKSMDDVLSDSVIGSRHVLQYCSYDYDTYEYSK